MLHRPIEKIFLNPASFGSPFSHELSDNIIVTRIFGFILVRTIALADVHYLRLATRNEMSSTYLLLNWPQFLPHRRSICPVYILQTNDHRRLVLKLDGRTHFKLRQTIGRRHDARQRMAA